MSVNNAVSFEHVRDCLRLRLRETYQTDAIDQAYQDIFPLGSTYTNVQFIADYMYRLARPFTSKASDCTGCLNQVVKQYQTSLISCVSFSQECYAFQLRSDTGNMSLQG